MSVTNQLGAAVHANVELQLKLDAAVARVAALEAARIEDHGQIAAAEGCIDALCDVLGIPGGARADRETAQSALDAVVSAAVDASRASSFRIATKYVRRETHAPLHAEADMEAQVFAGAVRDRIEAALASERARIRARVQRDVQTWNDGACSMNDVLSTIGGAP